jgi:hypothetical protein
MQDGSCILDRETWRGPKPVEVGITNTKCPINTVVPPDDRPGEVQNM